MFTPRWASLTENTRTRRRRSWCCRRWPEAFALDGDLAAEADFEPGPRSGDLTAGGRPTTVENAGRRPAVTFESFPRNQDAERGEALPGFFSEVVPRVDWRKRGIIRPRLAE